MRRIIKFDEYRLTGYKSVTCASCGRRVRRQRTFGETQNPWNTNADGLTKTVSEIYASLDAKAAAWRSKPETCAKCAEGRAT